MTYETKTVGHLIVKIPITRSIAQDGEELITSFGFEPYELLSEKLDSEYLEAFLYLLSGEGQAETMLDYTDREEMFRELRTALAQRSYVHRKS